MRNVGWLLLAILVAYGCAVVAPLLRYGIRGRLGALVGWCFVPFVLVCQLLIPAANLGLRAAAAFASIEVLFKMVEFFRRWDRLDRSRVLREYYRFLIPFPVFSAVYPEHKRRLTTPDRPWPQVIRIVGGVAGFVLACLAIRAANRMDAVRSSLVLNHTVMLVTFVLAIESLSRALYGLERLAGFDTRPIIRNAYLSRSVLEFWRRYNYRVHGWLYHNVFVTTGGRRAPARAVLLVFLFSGLFHEAAFALATSRLTGYQFAFFTIQGPMVLASGHFERLARRGGIPGKLTAHGITILFLAVTSILFFNGVGRIYPFIYGGEPPLP